MDFISTKDGKTSKFNRASILFPKGKPTAEKDRVAVFEIYQYGIDPTEVKIREKIKSWNSFKELFLSMLLHTRNI